MADDKFLDMILVVGSKEAVRLVGVGRAVHMAGMGQEDIRLVGTGWS
jgi:hypothetical protein